MKEQEDLHPKGMKSSKFTIELQRSGRWTPSNGLTWRAQLATDAQDDSMRRQSARLRETA